MGLGSHSVPITHTVPHVFTSQQKTSSAYCVPGSEWPLPWWGGGSFSKAGAAWGGRLGALRPPPPHVTPSPAVTRVPVCAQGRVQLGPPSERILSLPHTGSTRRGPLLISVLNVISSHLLGWLFHYTVIWGTSLGVRCLGSSGNVTRVGMHQTLSRVSLL